MSAYIDSSDRLIHDQERNLALVCPHCEVTSHITQSAVPHFEELQMHKPKQIGVVYRCDACNEPVFLRFAVRFYSPARIELSPQFTEVERAREKFTFTHLPEDVEQMFKEALICYSHGAFNAFASMCRRTAHCVFTDLGEGGKLRLFDELNNVREMAQLDTETFLKTRTIVFGTDADMRPNPPVLDSYESAIVLEVMKDLLYEAYVRKGRLQQALMVRRYFAEETVRKVTPITKANS